MTDTDDLLSAITYPIVACPPVDPADYPEALAPYWERYLEDLAILRKRVPPVYPGSIVESCAACGIRVHVGPRQQQLAGETWGNNYKIPVLCLVCVGGEVMKMGPGEISIVGLGNDDEPEEETKQ